MIYLLIFLYSYVNILLFRGLKCYIFTFERIFILVLRTINTYF
nr:MAG TPA: hypothetical protein [Caudoviricetes sp.]